MIAPILLCAGLADMRRPTLTLTHQANDLGQPRLTGMVAAWQTKLRAFGVDAEASARVDPLKPRKQFEIQLATSKARLSCDAKHARISGLVLHETSPVVPIRFTLEAVRRFASAQCAYKVSASARGASMVFATPFLEGGPPSLCCGAPALIECGVAGALSGWQCELRCRVKETALQLALARRLTKRVALEADVSLTAHDASGELNCEYQLARRRRLRASLLPSWERAGGGGGGGSGLDLGSAQVQLVDESIEKSAVWVATASVTTFGAKRRLALTRRWLL